MVANYNKVATVLITWTTNLITEYLIQIKVSMLYL